MSVCLSVRAVPGKFFQSLPVPCRVLCRRGGAPVSWGISWFGNFDLCDNYYPTDSWWTTVAVFYLSFILFFFSDVISLSLPLWRNPIGSHSLWSVLGGGVRETPVKHGAGGASRGGASKGGPARAGKDRAGWGAWAGKDWTKGSSTGALCTKFTLVNFKLKEKLEITLTLNQPKDMIILVLPLNCPYLPLTLIKRCVVCLILSFISN